MNSKVRQKIKMKRELKEKSFEEGYKEFVLNCKIRNLSPYTIKHYENVVHVWSLFYEIQNPIGDISEKTIDDFILFLKNDMDENDVTVNTNIRGIRTILYYFMKLGYMRQFKISKIKENKEIIETYSEEEIKILLKKPNIKVCSFIGYRNWVITNFLLGTGCRARTLINIRIEDLDFNNQFITYKCTKNRKQQIVPMSNSLKKVLIEYLEYRKPETIQELLFVNAYGQPLRTDLLSQSMCDYNRKRKITKTGVHRWRHTFAKNWILAGGDIFRLQQILGHSDISIIRNYVNMYTTDVQKDFNNFNPLELMTSRHEHIKMR